MDSKRTDGTPKEFWNIFRKISPKSKRDTVQPSMKKFYDYFKELSKSSRALHLPPISQVEGPLDYEMIIDELEYAAKKLKFGKACGVDNNYNEMILALVRTYPKVLLKLFNGILNSSEIVPDWAMGMIVPIHKDGPKLDTANYRGINLMSCLSKLFLSVLYNRLTIFAVFAVLRAHVKKTCAFIYFFVGILQNSAFVLFFASTQKYLHKSNFNQVAFMCSV